MEAQNGVSPEQFKLQHLRNRIAQITVQHEDTLGDYAVERQMLVQRIQALEAELAELRANEDKAPEDPENTD